MAATIRGIQPLKFGSTAITGYVNESATDDVTSDELTIEDEIGDIITQIAGFGEKSDVTIEVIPLSAATEPAQGAIFTYGTKKIVVLGVSKKEVKKDVVKWTIKGMRYPGVTLT